MGRKAAARAALERAKTRLDTLALYPERVRIDRDRRPRDLGDEIRQPLGQLAAVRDEYETDMAVSFAHGVYSTMSNAIRQ